MKKNYVNKYLYKSGRTILSGVYPYIIDLIYKIQTISGLKTLDEKEKTDLNIRNLGEFEFIKDETSPKDIIEIKTSTKLNEILKLSNEWMNTFENKVLPLIRKYETKLCKEETIKEKSIPTADMTNNLLKSSINLISNNEKLINSIESNTKYNDVNYCGTKPSISNDLKNKIKNNQNNSSSKDINNNINNSESNDNQDKKNEIEEKGKNEDKDKKDENDIDEDEILGLAMKMEQNEKMGRFKKLPISNHPQPKIPATNLKPKTMNFTLTISPKSIPSNFNAGKESVIPSAQSVEEKNQKYNDTNYWKSSPESLLSENEVKNILDDL